MAGIRRHEVAHVLPPALADVGRGDLRPPILTLYFRVGEQLVRPGVQKDRIVMNPVGRQHRRKFGPYGLMAAGVFRLAAGIHAHDKGFSDHGKK